MALIATLRSSLCWPTLLNTLGPVLRKAMCPILAQPTDGVLTPFINVAAHHSREKCQSSKGPRCSKQNLKKKGDCKKGKTQSMWENPDCCMDPCKNYLPRFDDLYYRPSDKEKRRYTRTWAECPKIRIVPKKICCFEKIRLPPIVRRKKPECPKTACPHRTPEDQQSCKVSRNRRCIKVRLPGCCPVRDPPRCFEIKGPSKCRKVCTPYPSYSECSRPKPRPRRPTECKCLMVGPICVTR